MRRRAASRLPDEYDFAGGVSIANYDVTPDVRFIMLRRGPHRWSG
jgi:hypothetical protein